MKALVITGGSAPGFETLKPWAEGVSLIIAADSGLETAHQYGIRPSIIVGDFDSLRDDGLLREYTSSVIRRFPTAKDETDTELALRIAREEGAGETVLAGGGGGRLDHLLSIVALFERPIHPQVWITASEIVRSVERELVVAGKVGDLISFFPIGCDECRMESTGLRWPLDGVRWCRGDVGVSNEFAEQEVCVRMISGRLLAVGHAQAAVVT